MNRGKDLACLVLTGCLALLAACIYFQCYSLTILKQPWFAFDDIPLVQAYARVAAEGEALPWKPRLVSRLNAPFVANWCDFPTPDELIWDGCGILIGWLGVNAGYNTALLLIHVLTACSFFVACRTLGAGRSASLFCAVSFSAARFIFIRDSVHINLSCCWHLPWLWVASNWFWHQRRLSRGGWLGLFTLCALTAWQNPYYWFFWQLMLLPCWLIPLLRKQFKAVLAPLAASLLSAICLFLGQLDSLLGWWAFGKSHPYQRSIQELIIYGLRLPDLVFPEGHHWAAFDQWSHTSYHLQAYPLAGEKDSAYLGLLAVGVMFYVAALGVTRLLRQQSPPFVFGMSLWLAAVLSTGGLSMLAGSFGLLLFRCTNRASILFLAGFLLFLALRLTRWRVFQGRRLVLLPALLALNVWDCMPPLNQDREALARYIDNQKATVSYLEGSLPARSMVFQWPLVEYPESQKIEKLWGYEQLLGYIYSQNLRFSYGNCRNRPESSWQLHLQGQKPDQIRHELEDFGFAALWLYSHGLKEQERKQWLDWRQPDFRSPQGDLWIYRLKPATHPTLPELEPCFSYSKGFYGVEKDASRNLTWRWVWGNASINLLLPANCRTRWRFGLSALGRPRSIQLLLDGKPYARVLAPAEYAVYRQVEVDLTKLSPGSHRLDFIPDGPALAPLEEGRRLTFQYINESLEPSAGP
ncbi:hypothetical protein JST97_31455 [bacterium]|nr:hypothetical protein [bacterium]